MKNSRSRTKLQLSLTLLALALAACEVDRGGEACPAAQADRYKCPTTQGSTAPNPVYACLGEPGALSLTEVDECPAGTFCDLRDEGRRYVCVDFSGAVTGASLRVDPEPAPTGTQEAAR